MRLIALLAALLAVGPAPAATVDVLVAFTADAMSRIQESGRSVNIVGTADAETFARRAIGRTNTAFAASGVSDKLALAGIYTTGRETERGSEHHVRQLVNPADGAFDDVHAERERLGADVVALVYSARRLHNECGQAGAVADGTNAAQAAFAVVHWLRALDPNNDCFAHEAGHLLGATHENAECGNILFSGRNYSDRRSIMAHPSPQCPLSLPFYSWSNVLQIARFAPIVAAYRESAPPPPVHSWHLPLLPQANGGALRGFIRLNNPTAETAEIEIYGYDESGRRSGPLRTTVLPGRTQGYDSYHLEGKRDHANLEGTLHDGQGHWRLLVRSATPIEVRAYTRTNESGFASPTHLRAALIADSEPRAYHVPFLNPGSNLGSRGYLRITNPSTEPNTVTLKAWDDLGEPAESEVTVIVEPHATVNLSAQDLEAGNADVFQGRFGDGTGKWRVRAESADQRAIFVLGLVSNRDGALHNVSR